MSVLHFIAIVNIVSDIIFVGFIEQPELIYIFISPMFTIFSHIIFIFSFKYFGIYRHLRCISVLLKIIFFNYDEDLHVCKDIFSCLLCSVILKSGIDCCVAYGNRLCCYHKLC